MHRTPGGAARRAIAAAALALAVALLAAACGDNDDGAPGTPTPTPTSPGGTPATPTPGATTPTTDPATQAPDASPERQVRDLLLRLAFDLDGVDARPDVDAIAFRVEPLEGNGQETWFAISTGSGVTERLGARSHAAGIFLRRADGGWTEVAVYTLQSTPYDTEPQLVRASAAGDTAWIAVFGTIADAATTFELLRFDGVEFASSLWWFSRGTDAARLVDLDGDGTPEIVLDAADRSVLCPGCGVVEHNEVIHRWAGDRLVLVEIAPLHRTGPLAALVAEAVAQANAGLWRRASATLEEAAALDPAAVEVQWMQRLARRIADARLAHAGDGAQPFLTHVLAGEHAAAVDLMRRLEPARAFDPEGPLMQDTDGLRAPGRMAELLVDYASRAIAYDDELAPAYAVRAFGLLLDHPDRIGEARSDLQRAAALAPDDAFYAAALAWLTEQDEGASPAPDDEADDAEN